MFILNHELQLFLQKKMFIKLLRAAFVLIFGVTSYLKLKFLNHYKLIIQLIIYVYILLFWRVTWHWFPRCHQSRANRIRRNKLDCPDCWTLSRCHQKIGCRRSCWIIDPLADALQSIAAKSASSSHRLRISSPKISSPWISDQPVKFYSAKPDSTVISLCTFAGVAVVGRCWVAKLMTAERLRAGDQF